MTDPIRAALERLVARLDETTDPNGPVPAWSDSFYAARAVLAQRHPAPVPVSERLPGLEDCALWPGEPDETPWCWAFAKGPVDDDSWERRPFTCLTSNRSMHSHWLPAHALPLPAGEVQP